jgi:hypothetical protein
MGVTCGNEGILCLLEYVPSLPLQEQTQIDFLKQIDFVADLYRFKFVNFSLVIYLFVLPFSFTHTPTGLKTRVFSQYLAMFFAFSIARPLPLRWLCAGKYAGLPGCFVEVLVISRLVCPFYSLPFTIAVSPWQQLPTAQLPTFE